MCLYACVLNISDISGGSLVAVVGTLVLLSYFRLLISGGMVIPVPGGLSSGLSFWKL